MNLSRLSASRRLTVLAGILALSFAGNTGVRAQSASAGSFLRVGVGARAKAMGGAFSALASGVEASYYNPAGLPFMEKKEVLASYRFLSLDRQFSFIGFATHIRPKVAGSKAKALNGGFALAWLRAGVDNIDGRNSDGKHFDSLSNSENAFMFAFALNPFERFAFGLSIKVLWNRFPNLGTDGQTTSANGVGIDFGALYQVNKWVSLAATVKDLNAQYRWNTQDLYGEDGSETIDVFPKIARYGIAVKVPRHENITVAVDYEQLYKERLFQGRTDQRIHIGAMGALSPKITLRAGYNDGSVAAGAGYRFPVLGRWAELNYAFASAGNRPQEEHIFTWIFFL